MQKSKIEIRSAYVWDCDDCGRENFERGLVVSPRSEDALELREELGIPDDVEGEFCYAPEEVVCKHCNTQFETERMGEEESNG